MHVLSPSRGPRKELLGVVRLQLQAEGRQAEPKEALRRSSHRHRLDHCRHTTIGACSSAAMS
jgi:hypothetical protein